MIRARRGAWVLWLAAAGLLAHTAAKKEDRHLRERVRWHTLQELSAAAPNKPALVDFDAPWCRPCWEMTFRVYSRKDVASVIEDRFRCGLWRQIAKTCRLKKRGSWKLTAWRHSPPSWW